MNSRRFQYLCIAAAALVAATTFAQLKIAVVDVTAAILQSEEAQEALQVVQDEMEPEQTRLQGLQDELVAMNQRAQTDAEIMSDTEKAELQNEIEDKSLDLNFGVERFQKKLNDERTRIFNQLGPKFNAVLQDLIELEGYDLVMNYAPQVTLYVNPKHVITRKVTEKLNDRKDEPIPDPNLAPEEPATEDDTPAEE